MDIILAIAAILFLASAIWSAILRAWPQALLSTGLFLIAISMSGLIHA